MRKLFGLALLVPMAAGLASCGNTEVGASEFDTTKKINVYSRDDASGTRDGFFTTIGHEEAKSDNTLLAAGASIVSGNGDMLQKVAQDTYGIGYASLASVTEAEGLAMLTYNGVVATEESIVDGSYELARNFNYMIRNDFEGDKAIIMKAFLAYMNSQEGLAIIQENDGILTTKIADAPSWESLKGTDDVKAALALTNKVTVKFGGSTSVEKIAEALTQAFAEEVEAFTPSHNHTGSGDAYKCTQGSEKDGTNALDMGFASRDFKADTEAAAEGTSGIICKDGIVVIVNEANTAITDADADTLWSIFGKDGISTWGELK